MQSIHSYNPILLAFLAGLVTWGMTAFGATFVLFCREPSRKLLDTMLGFAAGIMLAASFWSLLMPALAMAEKGPLPPWLPVAVGFLLGGFSLRLIDHFLPHLHLVPPDGACLEGPRTSWKRTTLLVMALTLHNIPEGLAIGVAFGAALVGMHPADLGAAMALALGIGIQDIPEGTAVAFPLRREGMSAGKSFFWGQLSGAVEPLAALLGAAAVIYAMPLLPYALAFAAGAMIYVVIKEVIPETQCCGNADLATLAAMFGFALMMVLDVALS
jgi:ZIP family zinc transporter